MSFPPGSELPVGVTDTCRLDLDGRPNLNLASFVGTYMEEQAEKLMIENLSKNMSDADEYVFPSLSI